MASGDVMGGGESPSAGTLTRFYELRDVLDSTCASEGTLSVVEHCASQVAQVAGVQYRAELSAPQWSLQVDGQPPFHAVDARIIVESGYPEVTSQNSGEVAEQAVQGIIRQYQGHLPYLSLLTSRLFKAAKSGELSPRNELVRLHSYDQMAVRGFNMWFENNSRVVGYRVADKDLEVAQRSVVPAVRLELFGSPNEAGMRHHFRYEQTADFLARSLRRTCVLPPPGLRGVTTARFGPLCAPRLVVEKVDSMADAHLPILAPSPFTERKLAAFNDGLAAALESGVLAERPPLSWRIRSRF